MKKKLLTIFLALTLSVSCLTACGDDTTADSSKAQNSSSEVENSSKNETTTTTTSATTTTTTTTTVTTTKHDHVWVKANCTTPKTCKTCGATEGSALGHKWKDATCTSVKTCTVCGATEGGMLAHELGKGGKCKMCGKAMELSEDDVIKYLKSTYSSGVTTPLGNISNVDIKVTKGTDKYQSYDYDIEINDPLTYIEYNMDSREYTDAQKAETKQLIKNYVKSIADDAIAMLPGKKLTGSISYGYYKYPHIQKGYTADVYYEWTNYDLECTAGVYYHIPMEYNPNTGPTGFRWVPTYGDTWAT